MHKSLPTRPLSLHGLRGFEAAARLGSLTLAAEALSLTQSAVSRQVKTLEHELGFELFIRRAREIELTPAGREFLRAVQINIGALDQSTVRLRRAQDPSRIRVSTFSSFASLWLIPRLASFRERQPGMDIDIGATDRLVDLDVEDVDLAIRYLFAGAAPPGATLLIDEILFPVVSQHYRDTGPPLRTFEDLSQHTLLELANVTGRAEQHATWPSFVAAAGHPGLRGRSTLRLDFVSQTLQAALRGQGVALSFSYGADAVLTGDLVTPFPTRIVSGAGCYLIVAERARERVAVRAFAAWITAEAQRFRATLGDWLAAQPKA
jgi:LysR family transcriptional regulator, glycine cleavage system transcriptional activator